MARILIVYGSTYGQTEHVAYRIASSFLDRGHEVDIHRGDRLPTVFWVADYDAVVIAASVLMGRHQNYIRSFVRRFAHSLNNTLSVFVSVCGAARGDPSTAQGYVDSFLRESGWRPTLTRSFAGAVAYTKYKWWFRWYLQLINRRQGLPTDTSQDWSFTEWGEVDKFAGQVGSMLPGAAATPRPFDDSPVRSPGEYSRASSR
jgi:menaquinone-dependent protoporphyrinogen oxidase